jgi:hypothetical protein
MVRLALILCETAKISCGRDVRQKYRQTLSKGSDLTLGFRRRAGGGGPDFWGKVWPSTFRHVRTPSAVKISSSFDPAALNPVHPAHRCTNMR